MNVRWFKQHLIVVIAAAAFAAVFGLLIFLERKAAAQENLVAAQLEEQQAELTRLRTLNPTPAPENIEAIRHDREEVQRLNEQLQKGAVREPVAVPELQRDIEFSQLMRDTIGRLSAEASHTGTKVAENFAFGFSRY